MSDVNQKRATSPAFQFYPKDFLSSTVVDDMSMTERGMYITLLSKCWLDGGLPTDMESLARMVRTKPANFEKMWRVSLFKCFVERNGKLQNPRLLVERRKQDEYRAKQAENGGKGGRPSKKPVGLVSETQPEPKKSSAFASTSAISDLQFTSPSTHTRGGAPIAGVRNEHRTHAECGRVCLPAFLFSEFVRRRGGEKADDVIREWAHETLKSWADKPDEPGEPLAFWRARYDERWPAAPVVKPGKPALRDWRPAAERAK
jgi:uncharacterized protein YdaU (DUF1376 family)